MSDSEKKIKKIRKILVDFQKTEVSGLCCAYTLGCIAGIVSQDTDFEVE